LKDLQHHSFTEEKYKLAYQLFYQIFNAVPLVLNTVGEGVYIYRAQVNRENEIFNTQARISYNKSCPDKIGLGKFNLQGQAMFYGCVKYVPFNESDVLQPYVVACLETCKDLTDISLPPRVNYFTIGQWVIDRPVCILNLSFDPGHIRFNKHLQPVYLEVFKFMEDNFSIGAYRFIKEVLEYFSVLCRIGSNESTYYILTALMDAIVSYHKKHNNLQVEGILSSSAASCGMGQNIVLYPKVVDEKNIYLNSVFMLRFIVNHSCLNTHLIESYSETIYNHGKNSDFAFQFKNLNRQVS
jgi:hypothetical protein